MSETVEEFLARGGKIKKVESDANAGARDKIKLNHKGEPRYVDRADLAYNRRGGSK